MEQRTKALIALIITLSLVGGVVVWMLLLNNGTLLVTEKVPFNVRIGKTATHCTESPCIISMRSGTYNTTIEKGGYFSYQGKIDIKRWTETSLQPNLELIPHIEREETPFTHLIKEGATIKTPISLISNYREDPGSLILPSGTKEIYLQQNGDEKVFTGENFYLQQDTQKYEIIPIIENPILALDWDMEGNIVYITKDEEAQSVYVWDKVNTPELVTTFQTLQNPILEASNTIFLIADGNKLYRVDREQKRKEIIIESNIQNIRWSETGTFALLETQLEGLPLLSLYNKEENKVSPLFIQTTIQRTAWTNTDQLIFISFQEFNDDLQKSFNDIGLDPNELAGEEQKPLQDQLMRYNPFDGSYKKLLMIPESIGVESIELTEGEKQLILQTKSTTLKYVTLEE